MAILAVEHHPLAHSVSFDSDSLIISLIDGRTLSVPLVGSHLFHLRLQINLKIGKY